MVQFSRRVLCICMFRVQVLLESVFRPKFNFNLISKVSRLHFPRSERGEGKKRDPGNEADSTSPLCLVSYQLFASSRLGLTLFCLFEL